MSTKHKSHEEYWADVYPRLEAYLQSQTRQDIKDIIYTTIAFYAYVTEDIGSKITKQNSIAPKLDLFLVYSFDQLRGVLPLYENLNLAPLAISARATFENAANLTFITSHVDPLKYADLYERFKEIQRLKVHQTSTLLPKLTDAEIAAIKTRCHEWFDGTTGKLKKPMHWTAIGGMNFEQLVTQADMKDYYSLYRTTSQFVHASSVTQNMYRGANGVGAIAKETNSRQFALLICIFSLESLKNYCLFFGVNFDQGYFLGLLKKINELSQ